MEEDKCFECKWHGNCTDEFEALRDNELVGDCTDYQQEEK